MSEERGDLKTRFGQPGGPKRGRGGRPRKVIVPAKLPDDGADEYLQSMRHVWNNHPSLDTTDAQKRMRKMMGENQLAFMKLLMDADAAHREKISPVKRDTGTENALEIADRMLKALEEEPE